MKTYSLSYIGFFSSLLIVASIAVLVMTGWATHNSALVQLTVSSVPMQFNTALGLSASATALFFLAIGKFPKIPLISGGITAIIGWLTLAQYIFGVNLGIDTFFVIPFQSHHSLYPGRMIPNTAAALALIGTALLFCWLAISAERLKVIIAIMGSIVIAIGTAPLLEQITSIQAIYAWETYTEMATCTAICLVLIGICLVGYAWNNAEHSSLWLPIPLYICMTTITLSLAISIYGQEDIKFNAMVQVEANHIAELAEYRLNTFYRSLHHLGNRWEAAGGTPKDLWLMDTSTYLRDNNFIAGIEWLDEDLIVRWAQPLEGNEYLIGKKLNSEGKRKEAIHKAIANHSPAIADAIDLFQGGKGLLYYDPLYIRHGQEERFNGVMVTAVKLEMFFKALTESNASCCYVTIYSYKNLIFSNLPPGALEETRWQKSVALKNHGNSWTLTAIPTPALLAHKNSLISWIVLSAGLLTSLLMSLCLLLALKWKLNHYILRISEMRHAKLVDGIHDYALYWLDTQGNVASWNAGAERIQGYAEHEIMGRHIELFYTPGECELGIAQKNIDYAFAFGKFTDEGWRVHKSGRLFWASVELDALYDDNDTHIGFAQITHDITERKQAEIEREGLYQLNNAMLSSSAYMLVATNISGLIISFNKAAEDALGYSAAEVVNRQTPAIWHDIEEIKARSVYLSEKLGEHVEPGFETFAKIPSMGIAEESEWTFIRKNGTHFPGILSATAMKNSSGSVVGFLGVIRDITERKVIENALQKSEETFRFAMEHASIGMAIVSPQGRFQAVNKALCHLLGYSEQELLQIDFQAITHPDDLQIDLEYLRQMLAKEIETYQMEKRYIHKNGGTIWVLLNVSLVFNGKDIPQYFISQVQDITEGKTAHETQQQLMSELNESNTELGRFAYVASHDMQEPLRMISNFTDLIAAEYGDRLDGEGLEYLSIVTNSALRMQNMVADLLEYARVGKEAIRFADVDVAKEIKHVQHNLSRSIEERNALFTHDPMPHVQGNHIQLSSLLQNLVSNGLKYQAEHTRPHVHIGVEDDGAFWKFSVKDNGIGMEKEDAARIFEPFVRLHTWQQYKGTGIGLAVCKKIVENHGGKIWVTSEPDKGSIFYFTIPKTHKEAV